LPVALHAIICYNNGTAEENIHSSLLLLITMTKLEKVINSLETALAVINGEMYHGEDLHFVKGYSRSAIEHAVIDLQKVKDAL